MAKLAIKGHATRGKEVIEILEMLGGNNRENCWGVFENRLYLINTFGDIEDISLMDNSNYQIYTLEEFIKKFPYKVGDKVTVKGLSEYPKSIKFMKWFDGNIHYSFDSETWFLLEALKIYKEETIEEKGTLVQIDLTRELCIANEVEVILGDYEFVLKDGKTYFVKKNKYPKDYEECCGVLKIPNDERYIDIDVPLDYNKVLSAFTKLLICRDAYWKIAGEEMGLGKPWEPDWIDVEQDKYVLFTHDNASCSNRYVLGHNILAFPTAEMRDAFFENFKDLIESCKELL